MNVGGPAVLLSELIRNLPPDDFEHVLITGTCLDNEIDFLESHPLNSEVIYIDEFKRSILPINDIKSFIKLIKVLRNLKPDIVHTHTSKAGVLGRLAAKISTPRAKIIHTYHGHLLYGYFPDWKISLIIQLEKFLAKLSDRLVAVTRQVRDDLLRAGIGPTDIWSVIRPGLEVPRILDKGMCKMSLKITENKFVISWIGRFTDIKNPKLALDSISRLPREILNQVVFVMAGSGELLDECQKYSTILGLNVIYTGWITDIDPILGASDLLLMTSKNEGMPVVIVEAALRKIPALVTNVGGVAEFISDADTGYLVSENSEEISKKIIEIFTNRSNMQEVAQNALQLALTEFSIQNFVASHIQIYKL